MSYEYDPSKVYNRGDLYKYYRSYSDGSGIWDVIQVTKLRNHIPIGTYPSEEHADERIKYEMQKTIEEVNRDSQTHIHPLEA